MLHVWPRGLSSTEMTHRISHQWLNGLAGWLDHMDRVMRICVVTSSHMRKKAVTPCDLPYPKTPCTHSGKPHSSTLYRSGVLADQSFTLREYGFIEVEFLPIKVLHCENTDFSPFAPVTLTLSRWPSYVNLTHIPWIYWMCKYELPMSGLPKVIVTILTDTSEIIYHTASWVVNKPSVIYQQNKLQLVNLKC